MKPTVAIACQGGGTYAAFAAGALSRLLEPGLRDRFELAALSGTSGGAICAALAWSGLLAGGPEEARRRLAGFWWDLAARMPLDIGLNSSMVLSTRIPAMLEMSPLLFEPVGSDRLRDLIRRHGQLEALPQHLPPGPELLIGATDLQSGERVVFNGRGLTVERLLASTAVPPLYRATKADGRLYWDGLFNINPPIRELTDLANRPDEIWVLQVIPQQRRGEPKGVYDVIERLNELAGNLSLSQELYFIDRINRLVRRHETLRADYRHITLRVVAMERDRHYPEKLDRSAALLQEMFACGEARAGLFFSEASLWPRPGSLPAEAVQMRAASG